MFPCPDKIMESMEFVPRTLQNGGLICEIGYVHSLGAPNKKGQGRIHEIRLHSKYSLIMNFRT